MYLDIVEKLSFPRLVGSEGHKKAQDVIRTLLMKMGVDFTEMEFKIPNQGNINILFMFLAITIAAIFYLLYRGVVLVSFLISVLLLVMGFYYSDISAFFIRGYKKVGESNIKGTNFSFKIAPKNNPKRYVVLMAHYDSKSQVLPVGLRVIFVVLGIILMLIAFLLSLIYTLMKVVPLSFPSISFNIMLFLIVLTMFDGFILSINKIENKSPGAHDNASGVAFILGLSKNLLQNPLEHTQVEVVLTDAEELGLYGAIAWGMEKQNYSRRRDLIVLNFDGVGAEGDIYTIKKFGLFTNKVKKELIDLLDNVALRLGYRIKHAGSIVGATTDAAALNRLGYQTLNIAQTDPLHFAFKVHTPKDTPETMNEEAFLKLEKIVLEFLKTVDRK